MSRTPRPRCRNCHKRIPAHVVQNAVRAGQVPMWDRRVCGQIYRQRMRRRLEAAEKLLGRAPLDASEEAAVTTPAVELEYDRDSDGPLARLVRSALDKP